MNAWSLFEHTLPQNVFVFARHDVDMNRYNSYVVIANDYDTALAILCHVNEYFAPWEERGTTYRRMVQVWDIRTQKEMDECRKDYMLHAHDYYTWADMEV